MTPPAPLAFLDLGPGRVAVKICGFTDLANLQAVAALGVDALGLNFWPGSKRWLDPRRALEWLPDLPPGVPRIGVFVNPDDAGVLALWDRGLIHAAQLHGDESPAQCRRLAAAGLPLIKAVGWREPGDLDRAAACGTRWILADAHAPAVHGGTGRTLDWPALADALAARPQVRLILSGGLRAENVVAAIAAVRPVAVDTASGVESAPGVKDPQKTRAFLQAVRLAGRP
jgi:phosphoribosylanthranilate isomerase